MFLPARSALCLAPVIESALKTLTLETLTCPLESKTGLSLGRQHFAGLKQESLLDLGHAFGHLSCLSLCLAPVIEFALKP